MNGAKNKLDEVAGGVNADDGKVSDATFTPLFSTGVTRLCQDICN